MRWEPVISLEIHVQLATETKMFCGDRAEFGAEPNSHVCPVCLGLPGALPVVNRRAVELGVRAALGLNCTVHTRSVFARKHYFYPDLPKGYQITQYDHPLATDGWLEVRASGADASRSAEPASADDAAVRIRRLHLEEDAGKSLHDRFPERTAIDLNRAGVPLAEIVTEPDLRSPAAARAFLTRLKQTLEYLEIGDCDMEKGSLRVDANVSVRRVGDAEAGTKTEVKNLNSFANVEKALAYEVERQTDVLDGGGEVVHETRLWDERRGEARPLRSKEELHDYRYFPDPDLPPLVLEAGMVERSRRAMPELPGARVARFRDVYGLPAYDAEVLTATRALADYFEAVAREADDPKAASNWVMTEVLSWLNRHRVEIEAFPIPPGRLAELIGLVEAGTISASIAKKVFGQMGESGRAAAEIVREQGLERIGDRDRLAAWADEAIAEHPEEAERYRGGETKLLGYFMGQVMKKSRGRADPRQAKAVLRERLGG
ncbi:MAG: Asp-tRNA(Asn)/Glu-tRNA(Gln) amidotransferase subunit GatB [Gemmatimonadota bacterium]